MAKTPSPLPFVIRAELFSQLAAMESAGLPADKAFSVIRFNGQAQQRIFHLQKLLARRKDIATAGLISGVFTELESELLRAAISAGSPASTYRRLAQTYARKHALLQMVKARLKMPLAMFAIALCVQPLPALVAGSITTTGYLWSVVRPLLCLGFIVVAGKICIRWLETSEPTPLRDTIEKILLRLPILGKMLIRSNVRDFFESLALMLEAGIPMFDAVPKACQTIRLQEVRQSFATIIPRLHSGASLTSSLERLPYLGNLRALQFIDTGESSVTLPEMLFRHTNFESEDLNHQQQQLADWIPRIVYGILVLWMAYQIIISNAFMPHIPEM